MIRNKKWAILVTLCSLLVGVLLMFQLKAQAKVNNQPATRSDNVVAALAPYTYANEQLQAENDKLQAELDQYRQGVEAALLADTRLKRTQLMAGLTPVTGPGLRIILDDSKREITDEVSKYIIHEEYLRKLVNALWNSKAEAIAINGQRLTALSYIFCTGTVINIGGSVETPPYVIEVIGDSEKLLKGIEFVERFELGLDYYVELYGIDYRKEVVKELQLPAGRAPNFKLAVPVKGES